jgi:MraZ protein
VEQAEAAVVLTGGPVMTLDPKGRLAVPTRHVQPLQDWCSGQLKICKHRDGCLWLFPMPVWLRFQAFVDGLPSNEDSWRRFYLGSAQSLEVDSSNRILVPPELREWAGLEREVLFMGVGAAFELWDAAAYKAREVATLAAGQPEALRKLVVR